MTKSQKYQAALDADAAVNALGRDPTDAEALACDATVSEAYRTAPGSVAEIADLADVVLTIEGDMLEPAVRDAMTAIRDGARALGH